MPFANLKVPAGTLDADQKRRLVDGVTDLYAATYGERARPTTMVLVEEVVDGGLGDRRAGADEGDARGGLTPPS